MTNSFYKIVRTVSTLLIATLYTLFFRRKTNKSEIDQTKNLPSTPRIKYPNRKGLTNDEWKAATKKWRDELHQNSIQIAEFDRKRAESIGVKAYIWRGIDHDQECDGCRKNMNRKFYYSRPPKIGEPGVHRCPAGYWCTCYAEPIIPD